MNSEELALALEEKRPEMLRIASAMLRSHGLEYEAEDFVQDAAVKMLECQDEIRDVGALLQTTVTRLIYDRLAKKKTQEKIEGIEGMGGEYTRIYQPDSQAAMAQRERLNLDVSLALDKLPDDLTREAVRLVWMEDHSTYTAARQLKVKRQRVTDALRLALVVLQVELSKYDHRKRKPSVPLTEDRTGVSASQAPYKEESGETDSTTPLTGVGHETPSGEMWEGEEAA